MLGAEAGAGAAVAAVAVNAAVGLVPASWRRAGQAAAERVRWVVYALAGGASAATDRALPGARAARLPAWPRWRSRSTDREPPGGARGAGRHSAGGGGRRRGGLGALVWVAFKVGALSYGGGFVIIPLMQNDAVDHYHWMTNTQFLNAVALGQITPGTGRPDRSRRRLRGSRGGRRAAGRLVAFTPSFCFVLFGARYFDRIRANSRVQAFLSGAGPAAIGAIAGSAIPLSLALEHVWQAGVLAAAAVYLLALRGNVVIGLLGAGAVGVVGSFLGLPVG